MTEFKFSGQSSADASSSQFIWFATVFAIVTYIAVSMRATLSPWEVNYFIDTKRLLSVLAGAAIFWLAIRAAERAADQNPRDQIIAILNISIPGALLLLFGREVYDLAGSGELAPELPLNLRWMLTWIGYFAAAISAFVAFCYHRRLQYITTQINAAPVAASRVAEAEPIVTNQMIEQVIDALTDAIAADHGKDLHVLPLGLQKQTGYEWADKAFDPAIQMHEQRRTLVAQISKRLAD